MEEQKSNPGPSGAFPGQGPAQPLETDQPGNKPGAGHTEGGAPTDKAHQDAGDGSLTGSVPAGLSSEELMRRAQSSGRDDPGSE